MKKLASFFILVLLFSVFLQGSYVGKVYVKPRPGETSQLIFRVPKSFLDSRSFYNHAFGKANTNPRVEKATDKACNDQLRELHAYFESEVKKGNLRIRLVQDDPEAMMEHRRYTQYYKDLEVFGGEIIEHFKEGKLVGINGEYYEIRDFDTVPLITKDTAVELFKADLEKSNLLANEEKSKLIIYPLEDKDYYLAYLIVLGEEVGYSMTGIIDARTGKVLFKYPNIKTEDLTIGFGYGYHGEQYKFPTSLQNGKYYLADESKARPVNQYTSYKYANSTFYIASDDDNLWDYDGALVSAHTFLGLAYDYYYLVFGRKGINDNNLRIICSVHFAEPDYADNAFWDPEVAAIFFGEPGQNNEQNAGAIDVVAHEYSHGVTDYTSSLIYLFESGALNESFSDIMATAVEFYWQEPGSGFLKADWYNGEDARPYFSTTGCRNLANPNSNSQMKNAGYPRSLWYPDPCHLSQEMPIIYYYGHLVDNGGVHINSTIYSHAYYLLANGGTNKISKKSVIGIGIDKATKIFYRAWTYYMGPSSNFLYAANALLQSAYVYGSSSNEYAQTIKAMEAIGWIVE